MKTLYLHIGTPKTATSSVQRYCFRNNEILNENSYSYPLMPFRYENISKGRNGHFLIQFKRFKGELLEEYKNRLETGLSIVHQEFEKYDNVILSEENLWRAVNYAVKSPIEILKEDAAEHGYNIKIVVYLRRQDAFISSRWNQVVKIGIMTDSLSENIADIIKNKPLTLDYAATLDNLAAQVGKENIIVRPFVPGRWVNNNIYDDFMDAINFPEDVDLKIPPRDANPGLLNNFFEIQRQININENLTDAENKLFVPYSKSISKKTEEHYKYTLLSKEETESLLARYEEGNNRIAKEYIGVDEPLFDNNIKDLPKWQDDNEYMTYDMKLFISELTSDLQDLYWDAFVEKPQVSPEERMKYLEIYAKAANHGMDKLRDELKATNKIVKKQQKLIDKLCRQNERQQETIENLMYKFQHPIKAFFKRLFKK